MAITTLSVTIQAGENWTAQNTVTGTNYTPISNSNRITKQVTYGTSALNAAVGGADELISYQFSLAANTGTTVNCQSLTNILGTASQNLARIKAWQVRNLSVSDDATYGTNCTSITVGDSGANAQTLDMGANTDTKTIKNGGITLGFDPSAAGWTVDNTHRDLKFFNNDLTNAAEIQLTLIGGSN